MRFERMFRTADDTTRRAFLGGATRSLLGVGAMPWLARLAAAQDPARVPLRPATARSVIYLYMNGGMSQLDTLDPKPGAPTQGPTRAIPTAVDGILLSEHFPHLAGQMDKVCLFRGLQSTQGAHEQGRYFMHTSYVLRGTIKHPTLGAWLDYMAGRNNPALPSHVEIGGTRYTASAGFLESVHGPLPIGDPADGLQNSTRPRNVSDETAARRRARLAEMNAAFEERYDHKDVRTYADMYERALELMSSSELAAFDITQEPDEVRDAYGETDFGRGCLLARRLVEHGVRFVEVVNGGWDTHDDNFARLAELCPPVDRAVTSLLVDLELRGLLDETLVVLVTEFGRTPTVVAGRNGRNHYPKAFSGLMAGGGVRGGIAWGRTDREGREVVENAVSVPDFNATIAFALGLPTDHVVHSPSKRPFKVAHDGRPVTGVFA